MAHPIPAISAKTPNAAIMLPSVSQSASKNPATAAIATYLFSIGNRTFSELGYGLDVSTSKRVHQRSFLPAVDLRVHRMLDPERAVLAEGGDAVFRRHEIRAARVVVARTNLLILLRWRIVPRRQDVGRSLRLCRGRNDQLGQERGRRSAQCTRAASRIGPFLRKVSRAVLLPQTARRAVGRWRCRRHRRCRDFAGEFRLYLTGSVTH